MGRETSFKDASPKKIKKEDANRWWFEN